MENKTKIKNVHSGHRKRVKANVCKNGFSQLEDHKLLELLLFYSIPQADTNEIAHNLLSEFGSFEELLRADIDSLKKMQGVGENTAIHIAAINELYARLCKEKATTKKLFKTFDDYKLLAKSVLSGENVEKVYIFCLNSTGRLLKTALLSSGDAASAYIDVKKALQTMMDCDAKKAFLAHNHPRGDATPSPQDIDSTRGLCVMFRRLGFFIVDHIIVGEDNSTYSMYNDSNFKGVFF